MTTTDVPDDVRATVHRMAEDWFRDRGGVAIGDEIREAAAEFALHLLVAVKADPAPTDRVMGGLVEAVQAYRDRMVEGVHDTALRRAVFRALAEVERVAADG